MESRRTRSKSIWQLSSVIDKDVKIKDVWPGQNRFYCKGACIAGPLSDTCHQCGVIFIMLIVLGIYYGVFCYGLASKVSIWLPLSFTLVAGVTVTLYIMTHCTDPGILPRQDFILAGLVTGRKTESKLLIEGPRANLDDLEAPLKPIRPSLAVSSSLLIIRSQRL